MIDNDEAVKVGDFRKEHGVEASGEAEFHDILS